MANSQVFNGIFRPARSGFAWRIKVFPKILFFACDFHVLPSPVSLSSAPSFPHYEWVFGMTDGLGWSMLSYGRFSPDGPFDDFTIGILPQHLITLCNKAFPSSMFCFWLPIVNSASNFVCSFVSSFTLSFRVDFLPSCVVDAFCLSLVVDDLSLPSWNLVLKIFFHPFSAISLFPS